MPQDFAKVQDGRERQLLDDNVVHDWYRFVLAYPDHLVSETLDRFGATQSDLVLDPFCGTGTTLVEAKKLGIESVGVEANPACVLASKVKTNWSLNPQTLRQTAEHIIEQTRPFSETLTFGGDPLFEPLVGSGELKRLKEELVAKSPEAQYFISSGMLERKWMSERPFYKTVALLNHIKETDTDPDTKDALLLAFSAILVESVANVSFGPEIYVSGEKSDANVLGAFSEKAEKMATDLELVKSVEPQGQTSVLQGDAREVNSILCEGEVPPIDFVITSPPYPTEKDYTRQTRLELVFLGHVHGRKSLQSVKKAMVRSHSKGIYKADDDGRFVENIPEVQEIADELREKVADKDYGFAKLYPRIIEEYFGGMHKHLESLYKVLRPGGKAAYVVGEQRTYLQTFTPTGDIIGILAERLGYEVDDVLVWRVRRGTTGSGEDIKEEIVIIKKPD